MTSASKRKKPKPASADKNATLRGRMADIRRKLDSLGAQQATADLFTATLEQLDAVADEIADATDAMMTACEGIQDTADAIAASPHLEGFKAKGVEVLLMTDPVDDFWLPSVGEFESKAFKSAARAGADANEVSDALIQGREHHEVRVGAPARRQPRSDRQTTVGSTNRRHHRGIAGTDT